MQAVIRFLPLLRAATVVLAVSGSGAGPAYARLGEADWGGQEIERPLTPGSVVERVVSLSRESPAPGHEADPPVYVENENAMMPARARVVTAQLTNLVERYLAVGQEERGTVPGYTQGTADEAVFMHRRSQPRISRVLVWGSTSYVGTEDQTPGRFTCLIEGGAVTFWAFRAG